MNQAIKTTNAANIKKKALRCAQKSAQYALKLTTCISYVALVILIFFLFKMSLVLNNLRFAFESKGVEHYSEDCYTTTRPIPNVSRTSTTLDISAAKYLMDLQSRFYCYLDKKNMSIFSETKDTNLARIIRVRTSQKPACAVLVNSELDCTVILFRGTSGKREWKLDLQVEGTFPKIVGNGSMANMVPIGQQQGRSSTLVHSGFYEYYMQLERELFECLASLQSKFIYIMGHSLGAATATLLHYDILQRRLYSPDSLYTVTIGGPRVGNIAFCDELRAMNAKIMRLHNTADVFCAVPFSRMFSLGIKQSGLAEYRHAGTGYLFNSIGMNLLETHCLPLYKKAVDVAQFTPFSE